MSRPAIRQPDTRRAAGLFVAVALLLAACSVSPGSEGRRGPTALFDASFMSGGSSISLGVESCHGDPEVRTLEETDDEIRIQVVATTYSNGDACADGITVDLDQPVGDRVVIDLTTGQELIPNEH